VAALLIQHYNKGKAHPVQTYYRPRGFQKAEAPRLRDNWYMKVIRLSTLLTGRLYPQEIFLNTLIIIIIIMLMNILMAAEGESESKN
jgi:hypothetical protein